MRNVFISMIGLATYEEIGLESINETGDRWSMPVLFTASLRF